MATDEAALRKAFELNEQGRACANAGDLDGALASYRQATEAAPDYEPAWFNMGLVFKQRRQWEQALDCNERAAALDGQKGDPAWWNLGIAATALRRWDMARNAWRRFGIDFPDGEGELKLDFGPAPVRLDPARIGEVVWGQRIDPARIQIVNVPTPASGHRWGDIVLHDGAPNGERTWNGRVFGVFDELERWQPSGTPTLQVRVTATEVGDTQALTDLFEAAGYAAEDWTASVRILCRACSEGQPGAHDHPVQQAEQERKFGLAAPPELAAARLLEQWAAARPDGRAHTELEEATDGQDLLARSHS
jgi:hypothetical protein